MYKTVGIEKLSDNQLCRLRNGHSVRVKLGNHHNIHLSVQQLKKLHSASKKGKASTITFDPYQKEAHGCGTFGDIARKTKRGCGVLGGILNSAANLSTAIGGHGSKEATEVLNTIGDVADVVGLGVCKKHEPKARKARKTRKGKGFFSDLGNIAKAGVKDIAQKGIEAGTNYITEKIGGTGVIHKQRRIVGRRVIEKKKTHGGSGSGCCVSSGGSLFPAGFSG